MGGCTCLGYPWSIYFPFARVWCWQSVSTTAHPLPAAAGNTMALSYSWNDWSSTTPVIKYMIHLHPTWLVDFGCFTSLALFFHSHHVYFTKAEGAQEIFPMESVKTSPSPPWLLPLHSPVNGLCHKQGSVTPSLVANKYGFCWAPNLWAICLTKADWETALVQPFHIIYCFCHSIGPCRQGFLGVAFFGQNGDFQNIPALVKIEVRFL